MNKKLIWGIVIAVVVVIVGRYALKTTAFITCYSDFMPDNCYMDKFPYFYKNNKTGNNLIATTEWKTYTDSSNGFTFSYPPVLSIKQEQGATVLNHSIVYKHPDPCDFKGDSAPLEKLTDFSVSLQVFNKNLKDLVQSTEYPGWDYVSKNPYTLETLSGYKVMSGVEGCGENLYYLTLSPTKTLVIHRALITELLPISGNYEANLKLPGIITPDQEEEFFTKIISSIKFSAPAPSVQIETKPSISVIFPNGGENIIVNTTSNTAMIPIKVSFKSIRGLSAYLIDSTGATVASMTTDNLDNGTSLQFYFNQHKSVQTIDYGRYKIKVCDTSNAVCDMSDNYFNLAY